MTISVEVSGNPSSMTSGEHEDSSGRNVASFSLASAPPAFANLPTVSVWDEILRLAELFDAEDLGHGCPDWSPPDFLLNAATAVLGQSSPALAHQPTSSVGDSSLLTAIVDEYSPRLVPADASASGSQLNPESNVLVTVGGSQALALAITALVQEGDEVVLIEPAFDVYAGAVHIAGGKCVFVPMEMKAPDEGELSSKHLVLDARKLQAKITSRTRLLVLNTPHNPTGKVFSRSELESIAQVLEQAPAVRVLSDEVYEHMTFDPTLPHIPFASTSSEMFSRTVSVYSAGKTFSATGWKVGWAIGPSEIVCRMRTLQEASACFVSVPMQRAFAMALCLARHPYRGMDSYYLWMAALLKKNRDYFVKALRGFEGVTPVVPDGSYYVCGELQEAGAYSMDFPPPEVQHLVKEGKLSLDPKSLSRRDYNFCRNLIVNQGVVSIPLSAFFNPKAALPTLGENLVRFAVCKGDAVLASAAGRMVPGENERMSMCTSSSPAKI